MKLNSQLTLKQKIAVRFVRPHFTKTVKLPSFSTKYQYLVSTFNNSFSHQSQAGVSLSEFGCIP